MYALYFVIFESYLHTAGLLFDCKAKPVTACVGIAACKLFGSAELWNTGTLCLPSAFTWFSNTSYAGKEKISYTDKYMICLNI